MPGPLDGITVLDFTRYQNGPHATVMLSDMGAEIIKVEMPAVGDPGRSLGVGADGFCSNFEALTRGKRSVTLNLYNPGSREIIHRLIERADVLTENFRPGFLDRLGYGYEDLR
ncbi:MAG: CoA transferase, partial [Dehalococcoidia bacterium]